VYCGGPLKPGSPQTSWAQTFGHQFSKRGFPGEKHGFPFQGQCGILGQFSVCIGSSRRAEFFSVQSLVISIIGFGCWWDLMISVTLSVWRTCLYSVDSLALGTCVKATNMLTECNLKNFIWE
jgi:hypothetical protein